MRVWIIDLDYSTHEIERAIIRSELPDATILDTGYDISDTLTKYGSEVAGILAQIYASIDAETMDRMPNLKAISVYGGGFDKIDVKAATERKIIVTRVPDYCNHEVTEFVLAAILRFAKRLDALSEQATTTGRWGTFVISDKPMDKWSTDEVEQLPQRVSGSTLFIIGYGKIGRMLAKKAKALGMKVLAYDPYVKEAEDAALVPNLDDGLAQADFVSIHAILTNETHNMIRTEQLRKMKRTAFLINASRGEVINEKDLIEAVNNKLIRGAAVDVVAQEPPDPARQILHTRGILVSPHIAYGSITALHELRNRATKNMLLAIKGQKSPDAVN